jgi:hypothetical protein
MNEWKSVQEDKELGKWASLLGSQCYKILVVNPSCVKSGPNPTTSIYNASVANFYSATGSLARFENKKYFIPL